MHWIVLGFSIMFTLLAADIGALWLALTDDTEREV